MSICLENECGIFEKTRVSSVSSPSLQGPASSGRLNRTAGTRHRVTAPPRPTEARCPLWESAPDSTRRGEANRLSHCVNCPLPPKRKENMNLRRYGCLARATFALGILFIAAPLEAHKAGICESERKKALHFSGILTDALRASVFGGSGVRYISRDLDLNGIGDVLHYLDKRFLPLVAKTNQTWAKYMLCITEGNLREAEQKVQNSIDSIGRDNRELMCEPFLDAWSRCIRNRPIN